MPSDMDFHRQRLQQALAKVDEDLAEARASSGVVELDQSSVGRVSRMDAMQQQAMAQGMEERLRLRRRKIEAALVRLEQDSYGLCCDCGAELGAERLDADPATVFCASCAEERESH